MKSPDSVSCLATPDVRGPLILFLYCAAACAKCFGRAATRTPRFDRKDNANARPTSEPNQENSEKHGASALAHWRARLRHQHTSSHAAVSDHIRQPPEHRLYYETPQTTGVHCPQADVPRSLPTADLLSPGKPLVLMMHCRPFQALVGLRAVRDHSGYARRHFGCYAALSEAETGASVYTRVPRHSGTSHRWEG